ncbi:MFS transporter [Devosia sp. YR412]|uniref:MFS transporter n=1 Tax=Devosia sp. YR412 TaxID=1881030 RepID=UPI000B8A50E8|nr:MFS transporter [Devosia sp. YR412]
MDLSSPPPLRKNGSWRHFLSSRVLSALGFQAIGVAVGWLVYDQTRSAFALGLVGLFQFIPVLILTFIVGHVADRYDRRIIGLVCQIVQAVTAGVMALGVWQGWLDTTGIFIGITVLGTAVAFERPTMAALLPGIVAPSQLQPAIATSTSFMQTAIIVGPALGGLLYGFGPVVPFTLVAVFYFLAAINVIRITRPTTRPERQKTSLSTIFAGVSFIAKRPVMLGSLSLDMVAVLLGGVTALLPMFARDILEAGPWALGFLRAAPAMGALLMAIWVAWHPFTRHTGRIMFSAVAIFGIVTIVFALSTNIVISVLALLILGAADTISVVIRSSLVQLMTPPDMRGRVNAVNNLFIGASNQLGDFESGVIAGFAGPVLAGVIGGVGTIAAVVVWLVVFPQLRRVQNLSDYDYTRIG